MTRSDGSSNSALLKVARLDTCVTLIDSAEFYNNLASMKTYEQGETVGTIAELMMEQVAFGAVSESSSFHRLSSPMWWW